MSYKLPPVPTELTCPFCKAVIPYADRCFLEACYEDEDGNHECDWTECCVDCFDKMA